MVPPATRRVRDFWSFYREYTRSAAHTATAAALAIFGLLVFVDPLFAVLAIGSYVVPPVVLYVLVDRPVTDATHVTGGDESTREARQRMDRQRENQKPSTLNGSERRTGSEATAGERERRVRPTGRTGGEFEPGSDSDAKRGDGDTDSDADDGDTDADTDDGDTDSDRDDSDRDSDADDGDSDTDT